MTKKELIEDIVTASKECKTEKEFESYLNVTLDLLEPKDKNRFSLWGKNKSNPKDCWK